MPSTMRWGRFAMAYAARTQQDYDLLAKAKGKPAKRG